MITSLLRKNEFYSSSVSQMHFVETLGLVYQTVTSTIADKVSCCVMKSTLKQYSMRLKPVIALTSTTTTPHCFMDVHGTNDNGDVCASIGDSIYYDFFDRCSRSFYTSNCSNECQTDLRQLSDSVAAFMILQF